MPRPIAMAEFAVEAQAVLRETRRQMAPLYEAALRTHNAAVISEAKHVAESLRIAQVQAKRLAGLADGLHGCADGLFEPGHGRAA
jgi:hypothetical protein